MYTLSVNATQQDRNSLRAGFINQNHPRKFYIAEKDQGISREKSIKRDLFITHL